MSCTIHRNLSFPVVKASCSVLFLFFSSRQVRYASRYRARVVVLLTDCNVFVSSVTGIATVRLVDEI